MASVNSKKHRSDEQLTKDDVENDDDDATDTLAHHAQPFARASAEVLATRRIVRAHRISATTDDTSRNPFAKITLVAAPPSTEESKDTASNTEKDVVKENEAVVAKEKLEDPVPPVTETTNKTVEDEKEQTKEESKPTEPSAKETTEEPAKKPFVFGSAAPFSGFGAVLPGNGFGSASTASSGGFGSSTTSTGFGSSNASGFGKGFSSFNAFGNSGSTSFFAKKPNTEETKGNDATVENEDTTVPPVAILPEHYELKSGEEDYECLLELRCRTWKLSSKSSKTESATNDTDTKGNPSVPPSASSVPPSKTSLNAVAEEGSSTKGEEDDGKEGTKKWSEVGIGPLRILRLLPEKSSSSTGAALSSCRIVQRRESSKGGNATNLILNLRPAAITLQATSSEVHVQVVTVTAAEKAETHLFKFKLASEAQQFKDCLNSIVAEVEPTAAGGEEEELKA